MNFIMFYCLWELSYATVEDDICPCSLKMYTLSDWTPSDVGHTYRNIFRICTSFWYCEYHISLLNTHCIVKYSYSIDIV